MYRESWDSLGGIYALMKHESGYAIAEYLKGSSNVVMHKLKEFEDEDKNSNDWKPFITDKRISIDGKLNFEFGSEIESIHDLLPDREEIIKREKEFELSKKYSNMTFDEAIKHCEQGMQIVRDGWKNEGLNKISVIGNGIDFILFTHERVPSKIGEPLIISTEHKLKNLRDVDKNANDWRIYLPIRELGLSISIHYNHGEDINSIDDLK